MQSGAKRVVIINDRSLARGGATKLALQLATGLSDKNWDVRFFAGDDGYNADLQSRKVPVTAVGGVKLLDARVKGIVNGVYYRAARNALSALIKEIDGPETIYHVHGWSQILSPSIFDALRPVARRTLVTAHDFFLVCPNGNFSIYPQSRQCEFVPLSPRCLVSDCDKRHFAHKVWRVGRQVVLNQTVAFKKAPYTVLAIQSGMIPYLVKGGVPEERIRVLSNGAVKLRPERTLAEKNNMILYVGRVEQEKGVDLLAAAARQIGARLCIIGEGEAEEEVKRIYPNAEIRGWCDQEEIAVAMGEARFLVMPSRCTEPFGLAAAEVLLAGVPALLSNSCLIGPGVEAKEMGARIDVFDRESFAGTMSRWLADDKLIEAMSRAAFENAGYVVKTEEEWLESHLAVYEELRNRARLSE